MTGWTDFLAWLQQSMLGHAIRSSSVWTYGIINLAHILGIATLFGAVLVLDLRLIGWPRSGNLAATAELAIPLSLVGFAIALASGTCMLATNGTDYATNPFLPIKFGAIFAAAINALATTRTQAWRQRTTLDVLPHHKTQLKIFGGISLLCWLTAISAGRMIGYW
jgi:formate-dependent nitrite reductase membrane component NrfD